MLYCMLRRGEFNIVMWKAVKLQPDGACVYLEGILFVFLRLKLNAYLFCVSATEIVIFLIKIKFCRTVHVLVVNCCERRLLVAAGTVCDVLCDRRRRVVPLVRRGDRSTYTRRNIGARLRRAVCRRKVLR